MGKFTFTQTEIPGVVVIEPQVFGDDRGYFMETYQKDQFAEAGIDKEFVQDNQSRSTRGVLRGLHFQKNHTQGKLVRVTRGEVFDVAVDCRPNSATFGKWVGVTQALCGKETFGDKKSENAKMINGAWHEPDYSEASGLDRKSTRLNSSHVSESRMPSSA